MYPSARRDCVLIEWVYVSAEQTLGGCQISHVGGGGGGDRLTYQTENQKEILNPESLED